MCVQRKDFVFFIFGVGVFWKYLVAIRSLISTV